MPKKIEFNNCGTYLKKFYEYKLWEGKTGTSPEEDVISNRSVIQRNWLFGKFELDDSEEDLKLTFEGGLDSYQVQFKLPKSMNAKGLLLNFSMRNWESINYVAVGFSQGANFKHVKIENPSQTLNIPLDLLFDSLAWKIHQKESMVKIDDIRIYIKGKPKSQTAFVQLHEIGVIESKLLDAEDENFRLSSDTLFQVTNYLEQIFPKFKTQTDSFITVGTCPLINNVNINWDIDSVAPVNLESNNTLRYSWFALHPVIILLLSYYKTPKESILHAAHDIFLTWYNASFVNSEADQKYNWYDHGVSERQLALILLYNAHKESSDNQAFSKRLKRLKSVILMQAELLASELFYCRDQVDRYHNHGCFQDLALLISTDLLKGCSRAKFWQKIAINRIEDQVKNIVYRYPEFSISKENSLGYQYILYRILKIFQDILFKYRKLTSIPSVANDMKEFIRLFKYPDGDLPSFGDSYKGHYDNFNALDFTPGIYEFTEVGYVLIKNYYKNIEFIFIFYATSLGTVHKHQDNLSFTLFFDGIEWFNDPSFYSHEYDQDLPKFLRSPLAHNNVAIPNCDYISSVNSAKIVKTKSHASKYELCSEHRCYENYKVYRNFVFDRESCSLLLTDCVTQISGIESNNIVLIFQFGAGVEATIIDGSIILNHPKSDHTLELTSNSCDVELINGWEEGRQFNGVTGVKFLQQQETTCLLVPMSVNKSMTTRISIRNHFD